VQPMTPDERGSMAVLMARTEELDADTRAAVVEVCVAAHQQEDLRKLFTYIASGGRHFLAYRGGQLVSHAVVTTRRLHAARRLVMKTAYVDAVATLPEHQGRGYGSAVMRRLATGVGDHDIACLETDQPAFYARLGWELWRGPLAAWTEEGIAATPDQRGIMILRSERTPDLDLDAELAIESDGSRIW
jgi:aminoglycoside 2'-N-acetyltransferase I